MFNSVWTAVIVTSSPFKTKLTERTRIREKTVRGTVQGNERKTSQKAWWQRRRTIALHCLWRLSEFFQRSSPGDVWLQCQCCSLLAHKVCTEGTPQFICPIYEGVHDISPTFQATPPLKNLFLKRHLAYWTRLLMLIEYWIGKCFSFSHLALKRFVI